MTDRVRLDDLTDDDLDQLHDQLDALRTVARGYCPTCGRGDAAPTVQHWEHQRQRADTAERERDTARQHTAAIAAQRDRLRQRMNTLADRWDHALPVDQPYARTLRDQISVAPFDPDSTMTVQEYTERGRRLWAFRCWGTDRCDGWLGLGHDTQTSALQERERHVAEAHGEPAAADAEAALARVRALAGEHPVAIPTNLIDEALHQPAPLAPAEEARLAQNGVHTPGCNCGHDRMGISWHGDDCPWRQAVLNGTATQDAGTQP